MFSLITELRRKYFPNRLPIGECINVCILIASILKYEHDIDVKLVHGRLGACLHTWLWINDIGYIDPSTDTAGVIDNRPVVTFADVDEYTVYEINEFDICDFYVDLQVDQLKAQYLNEETN